MPSLKMSDSENFPNTKGVREYIDIVKSYENEMSNNVQNR
jgi:hypothetical protein